MPGDQPDIGEPEIRDRIRELRRVPAASLLANPKNWRRHPDAQAAALRGVLSEIGYADALLARETPEGLMLIDGHLRAETTPEAMVPVLILDVSEEEADKILLTLDPLAAMATADRDNLGALLDGLRFESPAVGLMLEALAQESNLVAAPVGLTDPDDVPPIPDEPVTKPGDLWLLGEHRLLCGDATSADDVAALMGGALAELLWTDPPYGVAVGDKNKWLNSIAPSNRVEENLANDTLGEAPLLAMLRSAFANAVEVCTAGAAWYVAAPAVPLHVLFGQALKDLGIWRQTIQWVKNNATFAPMGVDYHWQAEPIFYGWLPNAAHRYRGGRQQTTVWEIDRPQKSPEHPTMKPIELVERSVANSSDAGQIVLDPFLGSGTTLIACERLGRRCYAIEIEPRYVDVAVKRWENFTGRKAVLS